MSDTWKMLIQCSLMWLSRFYIDTHTPSQDTNSFICLNNEEWTNYRNTGSKATYCLALIAQPIFS